LTPPRDAARRSATFGVVPGGAGSFAAEESLEMFRRICASRHFERGLVEAFRKGRVAGAVYLSLGQEAVAAAVSTIVPDFMVFTQHRCHAAFLSFGGRPEKLRDELLGLPTGTSGGRAGSNCIQCHEGGVAMFGHHGLIGENVPLAVGAALGSGRPAVCFFGDGAAEEDYVLAAMGFAATQGLPVLFVCEDNDLSILTPVKVRRSWSFTDVVRALGIPACDITDDPWLVARRAREMTASLPAFMNVYVCRENWHAGIGSDGPPEWDRFDLVKRELRTMGLAERAALLEEEARLSMERIWAS
jgi:TPP-dependent pyruvate/acetoin dehydrogenase alpha subunit